MFGNCQRPVFSLGVSHHKHKLTILWKFGLNQSSKLQENNEWKAHLLHKLCAFRCLRNVSGFEDFLWVGFELMTFAKWVRIPPPYACDFFIELGGKEISRVYSAYKPRCKSKTKTNILYHRCKLIIRVLYCFVIICHCHNPVCESPHTHGCP